MNDLKRANICHHAERYRRYVKIRDNSECGGDWNAYNYQAMHELTRVLSFLSER